jgi:hypothetical protein
MLSLLISLLILCLIFGLFWIILARIPIPADVKWIVDVVVLILFVVCLIAILTGAWGFPVTHWTR